MKSPYVSLFVVAALFIAASYFVQANSGFLEAVIGDSVYGMLAYVVIVVVSTVLAPVSSLPLLPVAVSLWGPVVAALLSIIGWFIGASIAYELSRRFGKDLIRKFIRIETIEKYSAEIPDGYEFAGLLLLRLSVPVDILSYALGLFTGVSRKLYYSSTLIGIIPFAFVWAYLGALDYRYQIFAFLLAGAVIYLGLRMRRE